MRWLLLLLLAIAGCGPRQSGLDQAERWLRTGRHRDALNLYTDLSTDKDPRTQVLALVGAARAAARLKDLIAAKRHLERAVALDEVPGASEEAYFELAERLRADRTDKPRTLNLYYRAAAGAERNRAKGFPYQRAVDAIAQMSMAP